MEEVKDRFIRYITIDTQSDPNSNTNPSTKKQFDLAIKIKKELDDLGLKDVNLSEKCYLTAELPSNTEADIPVIGFIAHFDTSPDSPGNNVKPKIIEKYTGSDIVLNEKENIVLSPNDFPELKRYIGQNLITTDGTTLLGADDKAGIAEIISAIDFLVNNPNIKHGKIKIAFTPDEEIGRGANNFDVKKFAADYAYTIDGGEIGELEYENFNAASLKVNIEGRSVHPGTAKNQMINSIQLAHEFHSMLPVIERPEHTEKYEGFFHLMKIKGKIENTEMEYIIRDHDFEKFEYKKNLVSSIAGIINKRYQSDILTFELTDSYYNMKKQIEPVFHIIDIAEKAMIKANVKPKIAPIRGGTDGSRLSYMGLPCPNIFTGGHNFHGRFEFIPIESMKKAVEVIVNIVKEFAAN